MSNSSRGFLIAMVFATSIGLLAFLPLFLLLPIQTPWRVLTWVAAIVGPFVGAKLGVKIATRKGLIASPDSMQALVQILVIVLLLVSVLPYLTRT